MGWGKCLQENKMKDFFWASWPGIDVRLSLGSGPVFLPRRPEGQGLLGRSGSMSAHHRKTSPFLPLLSGSIPGWVSLKASPSRLSPFILRAQLQCQTLPPETPQRLCCSSSADPTTSPHPCPQVKCIRTSALTLLVTPHVAAGDPTTTLSFNCMSFVSTKKRKRRRKILGERENKKV